MHAAKFCEISVSCYGITVFFDIVQEMDSVDPSKLPDEYRFECQQFFGDTLFQCSRTTSGRVDMCITAMKDGSTQLQIGGTKGYPRPNTLFIASNFA